MPDVQRRVFFVPADADAGVATRLGEALAEAVDLHNRLAGKSPHILRYTSSLQQNGAGFFVAHEPATPLNPRDLFKTGGSTLPEDQLLDFANGLFEALAAAHANAGGGRPAIHGGLCPGVLLTGEDGLVKIADFGVAPAICKALGAEQYLNLAVGPQSEATAAWEVLAEYVADRDDRLCGFVDPDKYGQDTLGSFEPGSDIIAAGMVLYVLAERKHPYLYYEAEAHRVVDMARMMSMGVPIPIRRKDLCASPSPAMRACRELVAEMLDRVPANRPSAADILRRFRTAAPGADLDLISAQRWVKQIESLLQAKAWGELQAALQDRPKLSTWPQDLLSRAVSVERQAQSQLAKLGEQAAIAADRAAAEKWLARLQSLCHGGDWKAVQSLLVDRPELKHWPANVLAEIEAVTARVAAQQASDRARAWQKSLQKAFQARDWAAVARRFEQRPDPVTCPPEVARYAVEVEAEFKKYREEQERRQRLVDEQHRAADEWLTRAKELSKSAKWTEAIDLLAQPPRLEHWPAGCRDAARSLMEECRLHLGDVVQDDLSKIEEIVRGHGESVVRQLLATRFAELLAPSCVETKIELVLWAPPETDADGRATLLVRVRPPRGLTEPESIRGALDFKLRGREPHISDGLEEFRRLVDDGLGKTLHQLQGLQLGALARALRNSIFPEAAVQAALEAPAARTTAEIQLLGASATAGRITTELTWDATALAWQPADAGAVATSAAEFALTVCERALRAELRNRLPLVQQHDEIISVSATAKAAVPVGGGLPQSLVLVARVLATPERGAARAVFSGDITVRQLGQASFGDALREIETKLTRLIVDAQTDSLGALNDELKGRVRGAPLRVDVVAPKRSKMPVPTVRFELKPKGRTPVALDAVWKPRAFAYVFPPEASRTADELLAHLGQALSQEAAAAAAKQAAEAQRKAEEARQKAEEAAAKKAAAEARKAEEAARKQAVAEARQAEEAAAREAELATHKAKEQAAREAEAQARQKREAERQAAEAARKLEAAKTKEVVAVAEKPKLQSRAAKAPPKPAEAAATQKTGGQSAHRRGMIVGVGVGAIALIAAGLFFALRGPTPPQHEFTDRNRPTVPIVEPNKAVAEANIPVAEPNHVVPEPNVPVVSSGEAVAEPNIVHPEPNQPVLEPNAIVVEPNEPVVEPNAAVVVETPQPDAAASQAEKLKADFEQHRAAIVTQARNGQLAAAYVELAAARQIATELADRPDGLSLDDLQRALPPSWAQKQADLQAAGYTPEGGEDANTGYPQRLRRPDVRVLALVAIGPADPLWAEVKSLGAVIKPGDPLSRLIDVPAEQRAYRIFYLDSDEVAVPGFSTQAPPLCRLPTRDEWFLAALKTRNASSGLQHLFDGRGEWCTEAGEAADGKHWICGGGQLTGTQGVRGVIPPKPDADLQSWWNWLTNPLVMQRRGGNFGEDLTAVRTVLPIFPGP